MIPWTRKYLHLLALAGVVAAPGLARAAPAEGELIRVVIEAEQLGEGEARVEEGMDAAFRATLEDAGYVLEDSMRADASVRLRLRPLGEDGPGHLLEVDISAGGALVRLESPECGGCDDDDLLSMVASRHEEILEGLGEALAQAAKEQTSLTQTNEEAPPPPVVEERPKIMGPLGATGVALAALGVGSLVVGAVELGRGKIYDSRTRTPGLLTFVDHRPAGAALVGVGSVALVAGSVMLAVSAARSKRGGRRAGLLHPELSPGLVGLGYSTRF